MGGGVVARPRLKCHVCGARLTAADYVGRSLDLKMCFYRCRRCGALIAIES